MLLLLKYYRLRSGIMFGRSVKLHGHGGAQWLQSLLQTWRSDRDGRPITNFFSSQIRLVCEQWVLNRDEWRDKDEDICSAF